MPAIDALVIIELVGLVGGVEEPARVVVRRRLIGLERHKAIAGGVRDVLGDGAPAAGGVDGDQGAPDGRAACPTL